MNKLCDLSCHKNMKRFLAIWKETSSDKWFSGSNQRIPSRMKDGSELKERNLWRFGVYNRRLTTNLRIICFKGIFIKESRNFPSSYHRG